MRGDAPDAKDALGASKSDRLSLVKVLAICGSLQASSTNLTLLHRAVALAPEGVEIVVYDGLRDLPLFNPDLEADAPPPSVTAWRRAIAASDALLIASPEYGHSLPGALKNAIDWVIGSGELESKLVAVTASTPIAERGRLGLQALEVTLGAVSARIVGGEPTVRGPSFDRDLQALLAALVARAGA
ncbi:NADPH-dependent FMN reductase [Polyangium sp. 6x1]|uniref:NADPH-dependent FMN reductase n=1 Tax=Polyangium sp. 6x1 TaxID=3042689 RepID=UPI002482E410|nr:NADPH-dependent FMN reductase [Polyangium sp. 6x1]MDI1442671.1 NADPH-dependent FMN reductase [Polyangium sp. 6x1]